MKNLFTITLMVIALAFSSEAMAQKFSGLDKSPADIASYPTDYKVSEKLVRVTYSRPQLKGRSISELAPAGKVWRTGANEAPEIIFYKDATVGGKAVAAGTYSLFTIPGDKEWTIILNKNLNQWGAYSYQEDADVVRVSASVSSASESLDAFSIAYKDVDNGTHMVLGWGNTRVSLPITF
ncbi:DUF2911 domain-containing protein [Arenibacter palladensis]|uniref:DUF2911 domain-containing protein n=1 Tax=Arenibacter palladensis TaxID=237373 RepID=UPI0026E25F80|nr:DUF2911 domain-containing protein [Arenibacter palladensis]MDO6603229.1 DUF2911 domain-containing protein [Arenibacter palladensis]|tara:strand:+ start:14704 stop:15243 length:540 start_codon:yes stop_codon:yes gene_type:complete